MIVIVAGLSGASRRRAAAPRFSSSRCRPWPAVTPSLKWRLSIVATPLQASRKIDDSPELAAKDFLARREDNDPRWVEAYVRDSREWLYDWLAQLGVSFGALVRPPGNTVPRLHLSEGKGSAW